VSGSSAEGLLALQLECSYPFGSDLLSTNCELPRRNEIRETVQKRESRKRSKQFFVFSGAENPAEYRQARCLQFMVNFHIMCARESDCCHYLALSGTQLCNCTGAAVCRQCLSNWQLSHLNCRQCLSHWQLSHLNCRQYLVSLEA
jgi:hypothetical protein